MIKKFLFLGLLTMGTFSTTFAVEPTQQNSPLHGYSEIHTQELKDWYEQGKKMIIVDARSKEYYDGTLIKNAIWLPPDVSDSELKKALPSKDGLIVVYCWSPSCPASKWLVDRLVKTGYTNVYKYPEGLQEWMKQGLPTNKKR